MAVFRRIQVSQLSGTSGDVSRVSFADRTITSDTTSEMGDELHKLVGDGAKRLLLNFKTVDYIASAGLNCLIVLQKRLNDVGGKMRLCELKPTALASFTVTKLDKKFEIMHDEHEALHGF